VARVGVDFEKKLFVYNLIEKLNRAKWSNLDFEKKPFLILTKVHALPFTFT
jgi:hypothetical protein